MNVEKRVFTELEAAEYLGVSRSTLAQGRMNGPTRGRKISPPYLKLGKSVRYLKEDLDKWLESLRINRNPAAAGLG